MPYLVFDIETAAVPFDSLADSQQEFLLRGAEGEEQIEEKKRQMSLNPLTAQVAAIGMLYAEDLAATEPKTMIFSSSTTPTNLGQLPDGSVWRCMPEAEVLQAWWQRFEKSADRGITVVTFNGRSFDCPFLMLRSALLRVRPSRNLMAGTRWNLEGHVDLQAELAFKEFDKTGPSRRWNFDFYCKAFGITSPKEEGITGNDVAPLFAAGQHQTIAEYCMRDVRATWELFKVWKEFLQGIPSLTGRG